MHGKFDVIKDVEFLVKFKQKYGTGEQSSKWIGKLI